jgi:hypothetical protein
LNKPKLTRGCRAKEEEEEEEEASLVVTAVPSCSW